MNTQKRRIDSDALSIGEFLRKPYSYKVPVNQREFAWTSEEVDILWEDVTSALLDNRNEYFLGAIVTSPTNSETAWEIVDGQQRLTTLSMILAAVSAEWRARDDQKRADGIYRDFLGTEDRRTGDLQPKITLNEINDPIYQRVVLRGETPAEAEQKSWAASNHLLYSAQQNITRKVNAWASEGDDAVEQLLDLEEFIAQKVNVILIEVGDESDAFVIFETLNDRGLELAVSDLVKNYLFSQAGQNLDRFKRMWSEISLLVSGDNITSFLRHFWLSEREIVRERELYRALRSGVRNTSAARQLIDRLRRAADIYAALLNPEHPYWSDFGAETRSYLESLILFKVTQYRPLAMAAMETFKSDKVTKVLKSLMIVSFRYTVISGLGTGNLEKIYSDAAIQVRNGKANTPAKVFGLLRPAYVEDNKFVEDFTFKLFTKPPVTRNILASINDAMENDPERTVQETTVTLEHIYPRNPGAAWKGAMPSDVDPEEFVERIGNLTLLEKGRNRGIATASFSTKKSKAFSKSSLAINRDLMQYNTWTSTEIEVRSRKLADLAKAIWRVNY